MADVFEADDTLLNRKVAVKVLHSQFMTDAAFVTRFRKEAHQAASLNHPNIVSIFDTGEDEGTHYIVMELVDGRSLRDVIKSEGALLPRRAAEIAAEVAAAVEVAHRSSVIWRDLKPGNILLTANGNVKATDLGIARALDDSEELTRTGAVIGTATYFSPEQAQGTPADERSDLYSLGVVLYEMLTGAPPFAGESTVAIAYQHVSEYAQTPSSLNPDVPHELDQIVMTAMEKHPEDRYQSAAELRADLLRYLRGEQPAAGASAASGTAETRLLDAPPATVPPDETARHVSIHPEEPSPDQPLFVLGVVGLILALAVGGFLLFRLVSNGADGELVTVPQLSGLGEDDALAVLQDLDLKFNRSLQPSADFAAGLVIETDPPALSQVEAGSFVTVIISTGAQQFPMPNLEGMSLQDAQELLAANGLLTGTITETADETEAGTVIQQDPRPGNDVPPGVEVNLVVSTGPDAVVIPPLMNLAEANARFQLASAGVDPDLIISVKEFSDEILEGFVISSEPPAGTLLPKGQPITLTVSSGPGTLPTPLLIGLSLADAQASVEALGLEFQLDPEPLDVRPGDGLEGLVAAQTPGPDEDVPVDGTVVVRLGAIPIIIVPDLVGQTQTAAQATATGLGLGFNVASTTPVEAPLVGVVIGQDLAVGSEVPIETIINVVVGVATATTTTTTVP